MIHFLAKKRHLLFSVFEFGGKKSEAISFISIFEFGRKRGEILVCTKSFVYFWCDQGQKAMKRNLFAINIVAKFNICAAI